LIFAEKTAGASGTFVISKIDDLSVTCAHETSAWIELTYDTPVYITSVQIRQVYNIGSIHKVRVWNNGEFTTVWGRHIDNGTDIQGGTVTGEVTGKKSDILITLTNMLEYPVDKIRIDIGSTSATWDGVDSVQLTGKTLVSAEQPARTDTKISYNNLEDKPTIPTLPAQVSTAEKTARTGTALRSFSPKDIADMDTGGGGGTGNFYDLSDIPSILRVVPESVTFSGRIVQWATGATASSQFSTGEYSASRAIGSPNTGLAVGANGADRPNAWAEGV
jgi:hypothetical protein